MVDYTTVFVEGTVFWAKVVGQKALHDNYDKLYGGENPGRQWAYELVPDDVSFLKEHRLLDRLKEVREGGIESGEYLVLKKPEFTKDGEKNDPIEIVDADKNEWDGRLLGNGTRVVAKLAIADFGRGKKKAIYTNALMVLDLVPYEGGEGGNAGATGWGDYGNSSGANKGATSKPLKKAKSPAKASNLDDLDDDLPF